MSLKRKTVSGAGWAGLSQIILQVMQLVLGIVLAHLLLPSDFGLVGMVYIFTGFVGIIAEMGMGAAIIQKKEISDVELSSAFWVNLIAGIVMMLAMIAIAPLLARFFSEPRLTNIARAISLTFLIGSLNIVHLSLLTRKFQFRQLAILETVSFLVGGAVAVIAALLGYGVWSLVMQALVMVLIKAVIAAGVSGWRPKLVFDWPAVRALFPFSMNLTASKMINYWIRNSDNLLIGKFLGSGQLGVYSRAYRFMLYPINQLSGVICRVMFPAFSSIQDDISRIKTIYLRMLRVLALITFPVSLGLMAVADYFVLGLLGEKWIEMIPILQVLCILSMTQSLGTTAGIIYQARGRADLQLRWTIYASAIILPAFVIGLNWGALGVARAYVIASILFLTGPGVRIVGSLIDMTISEYVRNVSGVFGCSAAMAIIVYVSGLSLRTSFSHLTCLLILVPLGVAVYLLLILTFRIRAFAELRELVAEKLDQNRKSRVAASA